MKNIQLFQCPSHNADPGNNPGQIGGNYAIACHVVSNKALGELKFPAESAMLGESNGQMHLKRYNPGGVPPCGNGSCCGGNLRGGYRFSHNEGMNIAYADGHVKWQKQNYVEQEVDAQRLFWFR